MAYLIIFAVSYLTSLIALLVWSKRQIARMSARLGGIGARPDHIWRLERQAANHRLLVRPVAFLGTVVGVLISLASWLVA